MRPIDGDAVRAAIKDVECGEKYECEECTKTLCGVCCVLRLVELQPTLDVQPVRHGHWKQVTSADSKNWALHECSECGNEVDMQIGYHDPFCLYCGAKMEEEK